MATLAHALQLIGWWIAPLIIFLIRRRSRFVSFHALQALLLQIVHVIIVVILMALWFATIFTTVFHQTSGQASCVSSRGVLLVSVNLARVYGHVGRHADHCDHLRHQSRARRMGRLPGAWQIGAKDFEDGSNGRTLRAARRKCEPTIASLSTSTLRALPSTSSSRRNPDRRGRPCWPLRKFRRSWSVPADRRRFLSLRPSSGACLCASA